MLEFLILFFAGIGAGIVTGVMGGSATLIVTPMLYLILNYDIYLAIGISLATDVVASIFASREYFIKNKLKIKEGLSFALIAFLTIYFGSYVSQFMPNYLLGLISAVGIIPTSIGFIKAKENEKKNGFLFFKNNKISFVFFALLIGIICGVQGAGGGIMMLLFFRFIMNFDIKTSIGTSIFAMIFIALFGSVSHFIYYQFSFTQILVTSFGAIIGSIFAAKWAIKINDKTLSKLIGYVLLVLGIWMLIKNIQVLLF